GRQREIQLRSLVSLAARVVAGRESLVLAVHQQKANLCPPIPKSRNCCCAGAKPAARGCSSRPRSFAANVRSCWTNCVASSPVRTLGHAPPCRRRTRKSHLG